MATKNYPYTHKPTACKWKQGQGVVKNTGGVIKVTPNSAMALRSALNQMVVAVNINTDGDFMQYHNGIYHGTCTTKLDHAVALVGYGDGYYIIRNSMGPRFGEGGYMRIAIKDGEGTCGIQKTPTTSKTN